MKQKYVLSKTSFLTCSVYIWLLQKATSSFKRQNDIPLSWRGMFEFSVYIPLSWRAMLEFSEKLTLLKDVASPQQIAMNNTNKSNLLQCGMLQYSQRLVTLVVKHQGRGSPSGLRQ